MSKKRLSSMWRWWVAGLVSMACAITAQGATAQGVFALQASWQDDTGRTVHLADWGQSPVIITMAYGTCRKVCSTSVRRMLEVQALADAKGVAMHFVVVSLDPQTDTPQAWQAFRKLKKLERSNWHFIRGSAADTHTLAQWLGVSYWAYDDHVLHDFKVMRLNQQGDIAAALQFANDDPTLLLPTP